MSLLFIYTLRGSHCPRVASLVSRTWANLVFIYFVWRTFLERSLVVVSKRVSSYRVCVWVECVKKKRNGEATCVKERVPSRHVDSGFWMPENWFQRSSLQCVVMREKMCSVIVSAVRMHHACDKWTTYPVKAVGGGGGGDVGACVEMICFIELCAWYTGIHWRWKRCICVWVSVCVCFLNHTRNTPLCAQAHNYVLQLCVEIQCIYLLKKLHVHMNSWCTTNTIKHEF